MSSRGMRWLAAGGALVLLVVLVGIVARNGGAQAAEGFDGYIQSGTCSAPTDDMKVELESDGDHDVEPYLAKSGSDDETVALGYYGSSEVPGFGLAAVYTDTDFSLVITDTESGDPVACGDILEPDADRFGEGGTALVQLLPVGDALVQGVAVILRTELERELDVTPTLVRIVLSSGVEVTTPPEAVDGYDGHIQGGSCESPTDELRVDLKSEDDHDVNPYLASLDDSGDPVTVAYYGAPWARGFGFPVAFTDEQFSLVLTEPETSEPVACGDILEPDDDDFAESGLALVQLLPAGDSGAQGFALIERTKLQRELDITPTRVPIVLFAPPANT
jgi:hypothetical protein